MITIKSQNQPSVKKGLLNGVQYKCQRYGIELKPVPRNQGWSLDKQTMETIKGFTLVAKRWIVERSFAWVGKCRRMAKDYELLLTVSKSMLLLVFVKLLLERLG